MKSFILSFIVTGALCAVLWRHWHTEGGPPPEREETAKAPAAVARPALSRGAVEAVWKEVSGERPPGPDHWAALEAVSDEDLIAWGKSLKDSAEGGLLQEAVRRRWAKINPAGFAADLFSPSESEYDRKWEGVALLARDHLGKALDVLAELVVEPVELFSLNETLPPGFLAGQIDADPARKAAFIRWLRDQPDPVKASRVFGLIHRCMAHEGAWLRPERLPDYTPGREEIPRTLEDPDTVWAMGAIGGGQSPLISLRERDKAPHQRHTDAPRNHSMATRFFAWADADPESAGLWLNAQPRTPELDAIASQYSTALRENPEAAVLWAESIGNPRTRLLETATHYRNWQARDPAAAGAWLAGAKFTEFQRLYIAGGPAR